MRFNTLFSKTMPVWSENEVEQEYRSGYIMAGIEAIQRIWIEKWCLESIDEIVDIIKKSQEKQIPLYKTLGLEEQEIVTVLEKIAKQLKGVE